MPSAVFLHTGVLAASTLHPPLGSSPRTRLPVLLWGASHSPPIISSFKSAFPQHHWQSLMAAFAFLLLIHSGFGQHSPFAVTSHIVSCSSLRLFAVFSHRISCGCLCLFTVFSPLAAFGQHLFVSPYTHGPMRYAASFIPLRPHLAFTLPQSFAPFALQSSHTRPLLHITTRPLSVVFAFHGLPVHGYLSQPSPFRSLPVHNFRRTRSLLLVFASLPDFHTQSLSTTLASLQLAALAAFDGSAIRYNIRVAFPALIHSRPSWG